MKRYEVKLIEKSNFILSGRNRKEIIKKIDNSKMCLPYIKKDIKMKIKELKVGEIK